MATAAVTARGASRNGFKFRAKFEFPRSARDLTSSDTPGRGVVFEFRAKLDSGT